VAGAFQPGSVAIGDRRCRRVEANAMRQLRRLLSRPQTGTQEATSRPSASSRGSPDSIRAAALIGKRELLAPMQRLKDQRVNTSSDLAEAQSLHAGTRWQTPRRCEPSLGASTKAAIVVRGSVPPVRPHAGRTVCPCAGRKRGAIEGFRPRRGPCHEGDVDMALRPLAGEKPEIGLPIIAKSRHSSRRRSAPA